MSNRRQFTLALSLGMVWVSPRAASVPQLPASAIGASDAGRLLSHYDYPPFVTGPGRGLTQDWAQWMNARLASDKRSIQVQMLPRKRLDLEMSRATWSGIVPWVSPHFFGDVSMQRYVWSAPVMDDGDLVLSLKAKPVHYQGTESLKGLKLGGVAGHVYAEFEPLIAADLVQREDAPTTLSNLQKLLRGRVDVVFLPRSGLPWWRRQIESFDEQVFIAEQPRNSFQRRFLISPQMPLAWREQVLAAAKDMPQDAAWQLALNRYGLQTLASKRQSVAGAAAQA